MCLFSLFTIYNSDDSTTNSEQSWPDEYEPGKPVESAWTSHSDSQGQVRAFLSFQRKSHLFQTEQRGRFDWPGPISHFDFFRLGLLDSFFENQIPVIQVPSLHDWERDTIPAQVESNFTLLYLIYIENIY